MVKVLADDSSGKGRRIGIAVARFNEIVTERMLDGALQTLREQGVADDDVLVTWVPGAFELPTACRWLAQTGKYDAVIMLGAIVTDGAMRVQLDLDVPVGFGVLTCATMELALARAGGDAGNKGCDAATAALAMSNLKPQLLP